MFFIKLITRSQLLRGIKRSQVLTLYFVTVQALKLCGLSRASNQELTL